MRNAVFLITIIFSVAIMILTVRGLLGNPSVNELLSDKWTRDGPFELSPERGRFALAYSLAEDKSTFFSLPLARFATPDLGYANEKYVSLFAPVVSYIIIPGYLIGKAFGIAQVGAFFIISLFAVGNFWLIYKIAKELECDYKSSILAGFLFLFATPAFSYAVTLYQHHISTGIILLSILLSLKYNNLYSYTAIWGLLGLGMITDYPNVFLLFPIVLFSTLKIIQFKKNKTNIKISISNTTLVAPLAIVVPLLFYMWFSINSYNKPFQLAGTIRAISGLNERGQEISPIDPTNIRAVEVEAENYGKKTTTGFFQTRNIFNGFYVHTISPDRGLIFYAPVLLFSIIGFFVLLKEKQMVLTVLLSIVSLCLVVYSMWGDPWGGWAFGSRYLIPAYAMLLILIGIAITKYSTKKIFIVPFIAICLYSIVVNTLGAVTTNAVPPQIQVLQLEKQTGTQQRYSIDRNYYYLTTSGSKSFIFNAFAYKFINPPTYFVLIAGSISVFYLFLLYLKFKRNE